MSFTVNVKYEIIENKYSEVLLCNMINQLIKEDFDVEVILENKHITAKIRSYKNEIKTHFHDEELPTE